MIDQFSKESNYCSRCKVCQSRLMTDEICNCKITIRNEYKTKRVGANRKMGAKIASPVRLREQVV